MKSKKINPIALIILIIFVIITLLPIIFIVCGSFFSSDELGTFFDELGHYEEGEFFYIPIVPKFISFKQLYNILIEQMEFLKMLLNSFIYTGAIIMGNLMVAPSAAFALAKFKFRFSKALLFIYILIMMMPFQVLVVPNYMALKFFNLIDTRWAIILPGVFMPFTVFLLRQYMVNLSNEFLEAATVEGASVYKIFFKIILPLCKPALIAMSIFTFAYCWNLVEQPMFVLEDPALYPLSLFLVNMINGAKNVVFAGSLIYLLPAVLLFAAFSDYLIMGVQLSELK